MADTCPDRNLLIEWLKGRIESPVHEKIASHLEACLECQKLVETDLVNNIGNSPGKEIYRSSEINAEQIPESFLKKLSFLDLIPQESTSEFSGVVPFTGGGKGDGDWGQVGTFRLISPLAVGGMSLVFQGRDERLGRPAAIKILKPEWLGLAHIKARFLKEAKVMATLDHPYLVPVLDAGEVRGLPYLVMPLLTAETLSDLRIRKNKLDLDEGLRIGIVVCKALEYLHSCGLIHRDVKPSNIWVHSGTDTVRLGDFGIVLEENSNDENRSAKPGTLLGTPGFQAPELILGQPASPQTDLFSLGVTLFEVLSGRSPFSRNDWGGVIEELALKKIPRLSYYCPGIPSELDILISQLLEKNPIDRPQSSREVQEVLEKCCYGQNSDQLVSRRKFGIGAGGAVIGLISGYLYWGKSSNPNIPGLISLKNYLTLPGQLNIRSLKFSSNGEVLLSAGGDSEIKSYNLHKRISPFSITTLKKGPFLIDPSHKDEFIACLTEQDKGIQVYRLSNQSEPVRYAGFTMARPVRSAFGPTNQWLVAGIQSGNNSDYLSRFITLPMNKDTPFQTYNLGKGEFYSVVTHPEKNQFYISWGRNLTAWNFGESDKAWEASFEMPIFELLISENGCDFYGATSTGIIRISAEGKFLGGFVGEGKKPHGFYLVKGGEILAVVEEKSLSFWSTLRQCLVSRIPVPEMNPFGPGTVHPNGEIFAYASGNKILVSKINGF